MFSVMLDRVRLTVRSGALFCLLALLATLRLAASAPPHAAPAQALSPVANLSCDPATGLGLAIPALSPVTRTCLHLALNAPSNSLTPGAGRRIFVEDTTHPFGESIKMARLQVPMRSATPVRPASPALRTTSASFANRQRAP
jgi:hypothetical protein